MRFTALPLGAAFRSKLVPAVIVAGLGDWIFYQRGLYGGNAGLFLLAILAAALAGRPAMRRDRRAWIAVAGAALFGFAMTRDPNPLAWTLFWLAAGMATLLPLTARFDDGWRWFQRLAFHALRAPFVPLLDAARLLRLRVARRRSGKGLRAAIALLALPVIGSAVIVTLFAAANPVIERMLTALTPPDFSPVLIVRAAIGALYFTLAWSLLRPRLPRGLLPQMPQREIVLPGVSVGSVTLSLFVFNGIFALQNLLDLAYLGGLAPMPPGMTLADYAHRGAYPLIATALLAALFVLVTLRPGSETARSATIRRLVTVWIAQNILLVGSSMLRTMDYVEAYSLTRLRIAALAWMVLVAFGLGAICWRLLRGRSAGWLINVNLAATGLVLTAASFVDLGAVAAQWNVRHAREVGGQGAALDLCYLSDLEDSAVLPLLELERRPGLAPGFRVRVRAVADRALSGLEMSQRSGWSLLGQHRLAQARAMAATRPSVILAPGIRGCDGALLPQRPEEAAPPSAPPPPAPSAPPTPEPR